MNTDPIADMLTRIRNAISVGKTSINLPHSKIKFKIAKLLEEQKFIDNVKEEEIAGFKRIVIQINKPESNPRINHIKRISKPGRRMYAGYNEIPRVKSGRGVVIVSTSKGIITDSEARKLKVGGELICEVY